MSSFFTTCVKQKGFSEHLIYRINDSNFKGGRDETLGNSFNGGFCDCRWIHSRHCLTAYFLQRNFKSSALFFREHFLKTIPAPQGLFLLDA
jgi:hypothetical protein